MRPFDEIVRRASTRGPQDPPLTGDEIRALAEEGGPLAETDADRRFVASLLETADMADKLT